MIPFWLIAYGSELVWDRTITAFVPASVLRGTVACPVSHEVIDRMRFFDEAETDAQIEELKALGLSYVSKKGFKNSERVA